MSSVTLRIRATSPCVAFAVLALVSSLPAEAQPAANPAAVRNVGAAADGNRHARSRHPAGDGSRVPGRGAGRPGRRGEPVSEHSAQWKGRGHPGASAVRRPRCSYARPTDAAQRRARRLHGQSVGAESGARRDNRQRRKHFSDRARSRDSCERAAPCGSSPIETLARIPALYEDVSLGWSDGVLTRFLLGKRFAGIRLLEWLSVLLGLPILYLVTVVLNKLLRPLIRAASRRLFKTSELFAGEALPIPIRLLLLVLAIDWFRSSLPAPLLVRQFWSNLSALIAIIAFVWLFILINGEVEQYIRRRLPGASIGGATSLLRLGRRAVDFLVILVGVIVLLRHFGIDPTPALAGLGVGGIAVALAAQKTLENVIAGTSLILDKAVRIGDVMKMGDLVGTVDHIGLRSTRIRTRDRTIVSVPNSQIANASIETLSARDKFWFHPVVGVRYETTPEQLREIVDGFRRLLDEHPWSTATLSGSDSFDSVRFRSTSKCSRTFCPRLGSLPGDPGTAPLRRNGHRQQGGCGDRVSVADDIRRQCIAGRQQACRRRGHGAVSVNFSERSEIRASSGRHQK